MPTGVWHSCFLFGRSQFWLSVLKSVTLQTDIAYINPCKKSLHITLIYVMASDFHIASNSLLTISTSSHNMETYPDESRLLNKWKKWKKREKADKNKGISSCSNQKCKVYKNFNIIIIVLRHEPKVPPEPARRCYFCWGDDCRDPYTGNSAHIVTCPPRWNSCMRMDFNNGKCLHNQQLNIYMRQSFKFSLSI